MNPQAPDPQRAGPPGGKPIGRRAVQGTMRPLLLRCTAVCALPFLLASSASASAATATPAPAPDLAGAMQAFSGALEAKDRKEFTQYRAGIERAVELLPDPSRLLYRLAVARLLAGDTSGAVEAYRRQVDAGLFRDPRKDPELAPLLADPGFQEALVRLDALQTPVSASSVAFELPVRGLIEGIAFDPKSGAYFFSSVAERKIYRRTKAGVVSEFVPGGGSGLLSPLGIAVDSGQRRLWIVSAGLPQAAGLKVGERNKSALLAFDLDTGAWQKTFDAPPGDRSWNDLELAADGSVFVSDPGAKAILRVKPDGGILTLLAGEEHFASPGGLALSADGRKLYIADWSNGLGVLDLDKPGAAGFAWMRPPAGSTVLGIDGLRLRGNRLIAIQNGVVPPRILSLELAADGRALVAAKTLERNLPEWDEPTLGVLVDGELHYVANSHWPSFPGDAAAPIDTTKLSPTAIRRLRLD
jgi:hypothetical protein